MPLTTGSEKGGHLGNMSKVVKIHAAKQPRRPHFIQEWAERRGMRQADVAEMLEADKSVVSRWFNGSTPSVEYQGRLAALFHTTPDGLFRHPDDDWLSRFFTGRARDEIERIKQTLEAAFPRPEQAPGQKRG